MNQIKNLKVAIVHHWLVMMRGGERVLEALTELFPRADIFTLVCDKEKLSPALQQREVRSSFLQRFPKSTEWYPYYLPLFPLATHYVDLSGYDLIISSDAAIIKGVRAGARAVHICYCHTPMRCVWNVYEDYHPSASTAIKLGLRALRKPMRQWDYEAAQRVTHFVANSQTVQSRIRNCYGRESSVIYPPVRTECFVNGRRFNRSGDFFLVASQLVSYKRLDLVVKALSKAGKPLIVIGDGQERERLQRLAGPNIFFWGHQPQDVIREAMQRCAAFVFAGEEDFGIVMAEAQACGKPVIAYRKGGASEIVQDGITGILFDEQTVDSILDALNRFNPSSFDSDLIRDSALRFSKDRFFEEFSSFVRQVTSPDHNRIPITSAQDAPRTASSKIA